MQQNCLGDEKPKSKQNGRCDPKNTFFKHVMKRRFPKKCLIRSGKLQYFTDNIKNPYISAEKKTYELLKLKTECKWTKIWKGLKLFSVLLNADMLYMELQPWLINDGKPIGIEILYKPWNVNSNGNTLSPVDFEIYFTIGLGKRKELEDLANAVNFPEK